MTLYRVSVLDHDSLDYVVHVCGSGVVWCLERVALVAWFEQTNPRIIPAKTDGRVSGEGVLLPVSSADSIGSRHGLKDEEVAYLNQRRTKGEQGRVAESFVIELVGQGRLRPSILSFRRKATEVEDRTLGVDLWCSTDADDRSGVQVKWDGPAEGSGSLYVQLTTESVQNDWTESYANGSQQLPLPVIHPAVKWTGNHQCQACGDHAIADDQKYCASCQHWAGRIAEHSVLKKQAGKL